MLFPGADTRTTLRRRRPDRGCYLRSCSAGRRGIRRRLCPPLLFRPWLEHRAKVRVQCGIGTAHGKGLSSEVERLDRSKSKGLDSLEPPARPSLQSSSPTPFPGPSARYSGHAASLSQLRRPCRPELAIASRLRWELLEMGCSDGQPSVGSSQHHLCSFDIASAPQLHVFTRQSTARLWTALDRISRRHCGLPARRFLPITLARTRAMSPCNASSRLAVAISATRRPSRFLRPRT